MATDFLLKNGNLRIGMGAEEASAILNLLSTTQGFLPPRMDTTARDAISSPATGLCIFNTDLGLLEIFASSAWQTIGTNPIEQAAGNLGASHTFDVSVYPAWSGTLNSNVSIDISNFDKRNGQAVILHLTANATGGYTVTWDSDITWLNAGNTPPGNVPANKTLIVNLYSDGTKLWGTFAGTY